MRKRSRRRGMALLMSLLVLPLIAMLAFALTTMGISNLNTTTHRESSKLAAYAAEAGVEEGIQLLRHNVGYHNLEGLQRTMTQVPATVNVTVLNNGNGSFAVQASNGTEVPPGFAYVLAEAVGNQRVRRTAAALCKVSGSLISPWNYAAFGYDFINLTGNAETDSYDSRLGSYADTRVGWGHADALTLGGHVGTNGTNNGAISFSGNHSRVAGRIDIGTSGNPASVVSGTAGNNFLSGDGAVAVLSSHVDQPPVNVPALPAGTFSTSGVLPAGMSYGKVHLAARQVLTLGDGIYVFDGLTMAGQAQVKLQPGAVAQVYITGNNNGGLDLAGNGVMNTDGKAENLTFYIGPNLTNEISVTGNASAYYRVYAPYTPIKIAGNGDIFGSIVGKSVRNVGNGKIHYDRAMNTEGAPPETNLMYRQRF